MAADNHPHYARIGLTLVLGTLAIIGSAIYIGGVGNSARERFIETYSDTSVSGLAIGSSVSFRGVKIGEVREIDFTCSTYASEDREDMQRIRIVMALDPSKGGCGDVSFSELDRRLARYVAAGMRAMIVSSGITGLSRIEIGIEDNPAPVAKLSWRPKYPLIPPQPSLLESFSKSATIAMNRFNNTDFGSVWTNIQEITKSVSSIAQDADMILDRQRTAIESTLANIEEISSDLRDLSGQLKQNPSLLLRPRDAEPLPETAR